MASGARALTCVLIAGCGFSTRLNGDALGDASGDGVLDSAAIDDDIDNDNVVDVSDNCPTTPNKEQHDEDRDERGDRCDPCPMLANQDIDTDGDAIGDACDPHPMLATDTLVVFDGFATTLAPGALPAGWTQLGGTIGDWRVTNGALELGTYDLAHLLRYDAAGPFATIEIGIDVTAVANTVPSATVIADGDPALATYFACSILPVDAYRRLQRFSGAAFTQYQADSTEPVVVPSTHRVIATIDGSSSRCAFPTATSRHALAMALATSGATGVGVRIRNMAVAIRYVAIYRSP